MRSDQARFASKHSCRTFIQDTLSAASYSGRGATWRAREVLRRQTEHLTRLVDDLLDVTRISRGKIVLHRERLDVRDVVRRTTDDLGSLFEARQVAVLVGHAPWPVRRGSRATSGSASRS
jgi:signal transduction histidine kinase